MLESFFSPASVAIVGASRTPGKVGHDVLKNLIDASFEGDIYPVNPQADSILDLECYPSLAAIGRAPELAVIVVPAQFVLNVFDECIAAGARAVVIITAGFKESGEEGAEQERLFREKCRQSGIRCIGPNCLGIISPPTKLDVSFSAAMPKAGNIAFFSQSGALGTAILDTAVGEDFGLSRFISIGNKADVDEADVIEALGEDDATDVILGYLESIEDGRKFIEVTGRVTGSKPVVILKAGRTSAGARAASSHTGSLAGADSAYEAAFKQCGVIRANTVTEFFDYARAFASGMTPAGAGIAVITNAGGPGIIATDAVEQTDLTMAELGDETRRALAEALPPQANTGNPIDVLGDARADRYRAAIDAVCRDENVHSILAILTPQTSTETEETAEAIADAAEQSDKVVVASFMGTASVRLGWKLLDGRSIPNYSHPDRAVKVLAAMRDYSLWRQAEAVPPPDYHFNDDIIRRVLRDARSRGSKALQESEARKIAAACGIPLPQSILADSENAAIVAAEEIGYPVVMKISSEDILHKSDAGGVKLGIDGEEAVRAAYQEIMAAARDHRADAGIDGVLVQETARPGHEVIVGVNRDPQFGPLVMFGLGGIYVELLEDVVFRVAPLNLPQAREMITGIRAAKLLRGFRGQPMADLDALAEVLMRISRLAVRFPAITECDLNPVMVYPRNEGLTAVDVRFGLA